MDLDVDVNWDQISRAADGMIASYGEDALAEGIRRAKTMRTAGRYTAAVTWDSICNLIKYRS